MSRFMKASRKDKARITIIYCDIIVRIVSLISAGFLTVTTHGPDKIAWTMLFIYFLWDSIHG